LIHPGAVESQNGVDDNCNGIIDESESCYAPYNPVTSSVTSSSATLSWNDVASPDKFIVEYKISGASAWTKLKLNGGVYSVTLTGLASNTTYKWKVRAKCNGVSTGFTDVLTFSTLTRLGETTRHITAGINLFPNPASNALWIDVTGMEAKTLRIFNELGQKVQEENISMSDSSLISVDVTHFSPGIYMISLLDKDGLAFTKKFTKQ
jgi:hypothetical protein